MSTRFDSPPMPELVRRLLRLGLKDGNGRLVELTLPLQMQTTLCSHDGTRSAIRLWQDAIARGQQLSTTELLIVLHHLRENPVASADLLRSLSGMQLDRAMTECSFQAACAMHEAGRAHYAVADMDRSVNFMLEAQCEFLFAATSGNIEPARLPEVLGKYAVTVAFSSRWIRTSSGVLRRAMDYHERSIRGGNDAPEAFEYLVELAAERFNQTRDRGLLERALHHACRRNLHLAESEIRLKRGLLRLEGGDGSGADDLYLARAFTRSFVPQSGVDHVRRALIEALASAGIEGIRPLPSYSVRLPFGFLADVRGLTDPDFLRLSSVVRGALEPMRHLLKSTSRKPNVVANELLSSFYRDHLSRPGLTDDAIASLLVEVSQETATRYDDRHPQWRYVEALLMRAEISRRADDARHAAAAAEDLATNHSDWPLPHVAVARSVQLLAEVEGIDPCARPSPKSAWTAATRMVVNCPEYRRTDLGGRSGVFAVEDARGAIGTSLVFKPLASPADGERERDQMTVLREAIAEAGVDHRFGVPRSLGVVTVADEIFHVIERRAGRLLSALDDVERADVVPRCVELLAIYHRVAGAAAPGRSGWPGLKRGLILWSRTLFRSGPAAADFVASMKATLPSGLALVRKRDAHAGNWVIDSAGRVAALDLESVAFLPVGHDLAQLIEDACMAPVSSAGFARRHALMAEYLALLEEEVQPETMAATFDWFALYRAIWLATSAMSTKAHHAHARELTSYLASSSSTPGIRDVASVASAAMRASVNSADHAPIDRQHRSLSKAMSMVLRHAGPDLGMSFDDGGSVAIGDLAETLERSEADLLRVANHPAEPRFEVEDGRIRARYGHSFSVKDVKEVHVEMPRMLYHGTSWEAVNVIAREGLKPMGRQYVHLTNNAREAVEVARRHGRPVLLAVDTEAVDGISAVADAVWAGREVGPGRIEIRNLFSEVSSSSDWLASVDATAG